MVARNAGYKQEDYSCQLSLPMCVGGWGRLYCHIMQRFLPTIVCGSRVWLDFGLGKVNATGVGDRETESELESTPEPESLPES